MIVPMPVSKGSIYFSAKLFVEKKFAQDAVARCLEQLSAEDREILGSAVAVGWYPLEPMLRFHRAVDRVYGRGDLSLIREIGRFSAEWQLTSFHKLVLRFKEPRWMLEKAGTMWRHYHDTGEWEVIEPEPHRLVGRLRHFGVVDDTLCVRLQGWFARAIELTGGKNVEVKDPVCRARRGPHCEFVARWE